MKPVLKIYVKTAFRPGNCKWVGEAGFRLERQDAAAPSVFQSILLGETEEYATEAEAEIEAYRMAASILSQALGGALGNASIRLTAPVAVTV